MVGKEARLVGWKRKWVKFRLQKAFQDFNSRAKEVDGAISWLIGFENENYNW